MAAETMQFDLVSPERRLASVAAKSVQIPGMEGDLTAMPDHAPLLTTLRPGVVKVSTASETLEFVVTGGFAEISPASTTILAELAVPREEFGRDMLDSLHEQAEGNLSEVPEDDRMAASQRARDVAALRTQLGL
jgi:F-type H+-transporting ATPase subunit epsilon